MSIKFQVGKIDVNKELATYSSCNGKPVVFSADTVTQGLFVAPQCWAIEDEFVSFKKNIFYKIATRTTFNPDYSSF